MDQLMRYDRRVSDGFLEYFKAGQVANSLVKFGGGSLFPLDLQFRRGKSSEHATLYAGLTSVLNVVGNKQGQLRLTAHKTHTTKANGFHLKEWSEFQAAEDWRAQWDDVETYLERVIPKAVKSHGVTEGAVQTAVSRNWARERPVIDREVTPSFRDIATKTRILTECRRPILDVLRKHDLEAGKVPTSFGSECDALAVDRDGRVLAVEVKPYAGGSVAWVAAQAAMYARVMQRWILEDNTLDDGPHEVLMGMLRQRQTVKLAPRFELNLPEKLAVVPVVALQRGASQIHIDRMRQVRDALAAAPDVGVPPVELYEVSMTGGMKAL